MSRLVAPAGFELEFFGDGSECAVRSDRETGNRRSGRIININVLAIGSDGIPAITVAKGGHALADCGNRAIGIDGVRGDAGDIRSSRLVLRDDQLASRREDGRKNPRRDAVVYDNRSQVPSG